MARTKTEHPLTGYGGIGYDTAHNRDGKIMPAFVNLEVDHGFISVNPATIIMVLKAKIDDHSIIVFVDGTRVQVQGGQEHVSGKLNYLRG